MRKAICYHYESLPYKPTGCNVLRVVFLKGRSVFVTVIRKRLLADTKDALNLLCFFQNWVNYFYLPIYIMNT